MPWTIWGLDNLEIVPLGFMDEEQEEETTEVIEVKETEEENG